MTTTSKVALVALVIILVIGMNWGSGSAQPSLEYYYDEETGHWIWADFLSLYLEASDPLKIYGRPITEAFTPISGSSTTIQYFQKARFISTIDEKGEKHVYYEPLGYYLYEPGNRVGQIENPSACRYFPETGYFVCHAFLRFFEAHGGIEQFGYPVSNVEEHNGLPVQYFEYSRFEFHHALPSGERVVLSDLGYDYFFKVQEDISLLGSVKNASIEGFLSLDVTAYPHYAVTGSSDRQIIYVTVRDQRNLPVPGAQVDFEITWPDGSISRYANQQLTDNFGIIKYEFPFENEMQGLVIVDVVVNYNSLEGGTVTSFRVWW